MTFTRDCHFNFIFCQQILMIRKLTLVSPRMSKSSLFNLQFCFPHSVIVPGWCYTNVIHKPIDFGPLQIVTNCSIMCLACVDDFWSLGYTLAYIRNNGKIWNPWDKSKNKHSTSYIHNKHCPYNDFAKVILTLLLLLYITKSRNEKKMGYHHIVLKKKHWSTSLQHIRHQPF